MALSTIETITQLVVAVTGLVAAIGAILHSRNTRKLVKTGQSDVGNSPRQGS